MNKTNNKTDLISIMIIALCAGIFIGFILGLVYVKDVFRDEIVVNVTPIGWSYHPYTNIRQMGVIDRQEFRIWFRNGIQTNDEWIGYSYKK